VSAFPEEDVLFPVVIEVHEKPSPIMGSPVDLTLGRSSSESQAVPSSNNEYHNDHLREAAQENLRILKEERKKVEGFKRELPLCIQLLDDGKPHLLNFMFTVFNMHTLDVRFEGEVKVIHLKLICAHTQPSKLLRRSLSRGKALSCPRRCGCHATKKRRVEKL